MSGIQQFELYGIARLLVGRKDIAVELEEGSTVADALAGLARECPALVGSVIAPDLRGLVEGNVLNANGRAFLSEPSAVLSPDEPLLILPAIAGG